LKQREAQLAALNDPRGQRNAQQSIVAQEASHQKQLESEQNRQQEILAEIQRLDEQLAQYRELDTEIARQELIGQHCLPGYQRYLENQREAQLLPERAEAHRQQLDLAEHAGQQLRNVEQEYQQAKADFNEQEYADVQKQVGELRHELLKLANQMQHHQEDMKRLEARIVEGEERQRELDVARVEYQELDELHGMTEQFRKLIKEAAPHVLKAMLADISAEANRIFGEVMGDRSAHLSWRNDYEVVLRRQGSDRSFAQLSGGEQMSAALAVRLALLKKLSSLNLAFFDEPTQNMDELRRMNLADQIRRVRGFDQLIVISHDDTFEQGLDSLIRLNKEHGETRLVGDEDGGTLQENSLFTYNQAEV
jgi:exonuclease SbcC